jgi:hypothetical protein
MPIAWPTEYAREIILKGVIGARDTSGDEGASDMTKRARTTSELTAPADTARIDSSSRPACAAVGFVNAKIATRKNACAGRVADEEMKGTNGMILEKRYLNLVRHRQKGTLSN